LERLAGADAFRSLGLDRRGALWAVKRLPDDEVLPLFAAAEARELAAEPDAQLPDMALSEHVIADYQTLRLSLKGHPMEFLRDLMRTERVLTCVAATALPDGAPARVAGVVLVRQRPGTAAGVVFMTIEDETGIANVVVWPKILERFRKELMGARLMLVEGRIQRSPEDIVHVIAERLIDRSGELSRLSAQRANRPFVGNVDDLVHGKPRPAGHPRNARIIPKSRDFH
jgi:error-prone DNA polymerase